MFIAFSILTILTLSILGIFLMRDKDIIVQGQIEAEEYNISGLLPKIFLSWARKVPNPCLSKNCIKHPPL